MNDLMTRSFLSYVELKKQAEKDLECELVSECQLNSTDEPNLSQFFQEVAAIKIEMGEITNLLSELQLLNEETKSVHSTNVLRGLRDRIESDIVFVLRKAKVVKARLESLERSNILNRRISDRYKEGSPIDRTRASVANGLRVKLREIMNEFQFLRDKVLSDYKNDLRRRYFAATGEDPSEEVIEKMISGGVGVQMFERKVEVDFKSEERHEAVMDIQRSLKNLHRVFLDMAVLLETQGEQLDDIEENVASAGNYIAGGTNSLSYANQLKTKKKTWVYWVLAVVAIILLVCLISQLAS